MSFLSYPLFSLHCSLRSIRCCFPSLPHPSSPLPSPFHLIWLLCLLIVPTADDCDTIPDSLTREDNPLVVHFSSLGIATVPSSPIRPREAGPSEAPQLVLVWQTTLNIELTLRQLGLCFAGLTGFDLTSPANFESFRRHVKLFLEC